MTAASRPDTTLSNNQSQYGEVNKGVWLYAQCLATLQQAAAACWVSRVLEWCMETVTKDCSQAQSGMPCHSIDPVGVTLLMLQGCNVLMLLLAQLALGSCWWLQHAEW